MDGSRPPDFYHVLLPGFSEQMMIPPAFTRHIWYEKHQMATILSPLGNFWDVELKRHGGNVFFIDGWEEFTRAHNFRVGFTLVFRYEGNMVFTLRVYDHSLCEKVYTADAGEASAEDEDEDEDDDDEEDYSKEDDEDYVEEEEDNINEDYKDSRVNRNPNNTFMRVIREFNMKYNKIVVPKKFCKFYGLNKQQGLVLKDEKGRSWLVQFRLSKSCNLLCGGWANFSSANDLQVGDICAFKFVSKREMHVTIHKLQYEGQRDMIYNQTFNLDQVAFATEGLKDAQRTSMQDDMMDMMDISTEIQESLGRSYNVPDYIDEEELMGELDALEADMGAETESDSIPSYLQPDKESDLDAELNLPAAPTGNAEAVHNRANPQDELGLPSVPQASMRN